jgi:hypothetical protein
MLPDSEATLASDSPIVCALEHPIFRKLTDLMFRRAEADETPVMVMSLGERVAAVPLRALQREFGIADDSADGRMLGLIARSLDFVGAMQLGDPLPTEVLDGRASWAPGEVHRAVAAARLRLKLAAWLQPETTDSMPPDPGAICRLDEDPQMRQQVNAALERAAHDLGLSDRSQVLPLLEALAEELSYIEALREGLLQRVRDTVGRIDRVCRSGRVDQKRLEMITQVRRLSAAGLQQIAERFNELDAQNEEVMSALRNLDSQRDLIRSSRDRLYRLSRAWEPTLHDWEQSDHLTDVAQWQLIDRTYHFLAPRYMPVQEWQALLTGQHVARPKPIGTVMKW